MNQPPTHLVLGASGAMGRAVVAALRDAELTVIGLERRRSVPGLETLHADLCDAAATRAAIARADFVYLCVGVAYNTAAWRREWPLVMGNVLAGCAAQGARLIFLDNVDLYGPPPLPVPFDETTNQEPTGDKAKVRKEVARMALDADAAGSVAALVARSGNFFGPGMVNSPIYTGLIHNIVRGKRPVFLGAPDVPHTFAYTRDNARAMVRLALDDGAYGQAWHLPVSRPVTARQLTELVNRATGSHHRLIGVPRPVRRAMGRFIPLIGEVEEMMHHFDHPYVMSWRKFHERYPDFEISDLDSAIRDTVVDLAPARPPLG